MQLSIIIVNYNVRYFLEQCLRSVLVAVEGMAAEVIVVDNHSIDGSMEYLQPRFPGIQFIINTQNLGFAKANNRALLQCSGEYILFLNPDTLVPEDCLRNCLLFIKENPRTGALGVRMLDGRGRFLPESKRSFPSPANSFYKLTGLSALFPTSKIFNSYALGDLDEYKNHSVDVLAGAFMMVRKKILDQLNGFDEDYFLYGEDIDLSFRIKKAGFENIYFAETSIIHFKGESSENHELIRIKFFYEAMRTFVKKNYHSGSAKMFSVLLQVAIVCRAVVAAASKIVKPFLVPVIDASIVWFSLQAMRMLWIHMIRSGKDFGVPFISYALPAFSLLFILSAALTGLYDKQKQTSKTLLSVSFATLVMLAVYSLLPESLRFSRGVILWGGIIGSILVLLLRIIFPGTADSEEQIVLVADENEYSKTVKLLEKAIWDQNLLGRISIGVNDNQSLCALEELPALLQQTRISHIIFCTGSISLKEIILQVQLLRKLNTRFLFHTSGSESIVGSHTIAPGGTVVTSFADYRIMHSYQQRMKRVLDIILSFILLPTIPVHFIMYAKSGSFMRNIFSVFNGDKTWVGYATPCASLPRIKPAVISPTGEQKSINPNLEERSDKLYAKNYDWWQDIGIVFRNYKRLG